MDRAEFCMRLLGYTVPGEAVVAGAESMLKKERDSDRREALLGIVERVRVPYVGRVHSEATIMLNQRMQSE